MKSFLANETDKVLAHKTSRAQRIGPTAVTVSSKHILLTCQASLVSEFRRYLDLGGKEWSLFLETNVI